MIKLFPSLAMALAIAVSGSVDRAWAQQTTNPPAAQANIATGRVRVFLECDCFATFIREEIEWVDFVRQPQDADVHVLSAQNSTGGGGEETVLRFKGLGRFQGADMELKSIAQNGDTEDARRKQMLRTMTVGLLSYVERAGRGGDLKIDVEQLTGRTQTSVSADPWHAWVFSLRGGGSTRRQETNREWDWQIQASADRVTEQWIVSFGLRSQNNQEEFELDEDEESGEPLKVLRRERSAEWFVAKALGGHFSGGLEGGISSSTFGNRRLASTWAPAVEYNIFPYSDYASRQLRIKYSLGMERAEYNEVTLFGKLQETNPVHSLDVTLEQVQPWGELQIGSSFRQYLHDAAKYRFSVNGDLSFRISRGLSLNLEAGASRVRDQISLPSRGASPEEVLLRLRELQSGYNVEMDVGLTFRFGSIFNNIVNPRFGR